MKDARIFAVAALAVVCFGQEQSGPARPMAATAPVPAPLSVKRLDPVDFAAVSKMEAAFEQKVQELDPADRFDRLGACSGVYLSGYGMVFTIPISLVASPIFSPFTGGYTPQKADAVHKRKLAHLPVLRKAMSEMALQAAKALPALPPNEQVAVAARLFYLDYEDKSGLPNLIVVKAEHGAVLAGSTQTVIEEQ
jgi:hypothetical protein